ncbi:MAG: CBS domain-containing protein [Bdellovibrionota bacterium]
MTLIEPYIHRRLVILRPDTPCQQVARVMCERGIGSIIISDYDGNIAGIVTDRDLTCGIIADLKGAGSKGLDDSVSSIMTAGPVSVNENVDIKEVVRLMEKHGIRRIPVTQETQHGKKKCVGLVTLDDLIASKAVDLDQISSIVRRQIMRRGMQRLLPRGRATERIERSDARKSQTLNLFYKAVGEKTGLTQEFAAKVIKYILGCVVQRMHYTGAMHLIAQLPQDIQDELLALSPGPDRSFTVLRILSGLRDKFDIEEATARSIMLRAFSALVELLDPSEIEHVKSQLPDEMKALFVVAEAKPVAA